MELIVTKISEGSIYTFRKTKQQQQKKIIFKNRLSNVSINQRT